MIEKNEYKTIRKHILGDKELSHTTKSPETLRFTEYNPLGGSSYYIHFDNIAELKEFLEQIIKNIEDVL